MKVAWKEHYERLSNVEFDWEPDSLMEVYPVEGPAHPHPTWAGDQGHQAYEKW